MKRLPVILAAAAVVLACAACSDRHERVVHTVLPVARELREGAPVRYRGIVVGQVTSMRIVDTGVRLDLRIERADAPLRAADPVRIVPMGIFGDREVEIVPGPLGAPRLASNGWLAAFPPDTLAAIREALIGAMVKNSFDRLGVRDSASPALKRADSLPPSAPRSHR